MKKRGGRKGGRTSRRGGSAGAKGPVSTSGLDSISSVSGLFYESEDDIVRRLMDRVHRGYPLKAVRP
jgi:hypothetical protein